MIGVEGDGVYEPIQVYQRFNPNVSDAVFRIESCFPGVNMSDNGNSTLLVIDDEPLIVRLIVRSFRDEFNEIIISTTPEEAEEKLQQHTITHVICDAYLGPDTPHGISLIQKWYAEVPSLKKAVLFTGRDLSSIPRVPGIEVISKNDDPVRLLNTLRTSLEAPPAPY